MPPLQPKPAFRQARELAAQTSVHGGTSEDYEETRVWAIYAGDGSTPPLSVDTSLDSVQFKKECDQPLVVNYAAGTFTAQMTIESTVEPNPSTIAFPFDNSFARELPGFYVARRPTRVRAPRLRQPQRPPRS